MVEGPGYVPGILGMSEKSWSHWKKDGCITYGIGYIGDIYGYLTSMWRSLTVESNECGWQSACPSGKMHFQDATFESWLVHPPFKGNSSHTVHLWMFNNFDAEHPIHFWIWLFLWLPKEGNFQLNDSRNGLIAPRPEALGQFRIATVAFHGKFQGIGIEQFPPPQRAVVVAENSSFLWILFR